MKIDSSEIFDAIGSLLYAIAADQHVKPLEVGELKLLISERWLPRNYKGNESIVSDETHYILTAMDDLTANDTSATDAFARFSRFNALHSYVFTGEVKRAIIDTAEDILRIFEYDNPGDNKHFNLLMELWGVNQPEKA